MFDYRQYKRGYFMPPVECNDWVKKEYIDKAPVWCSVDLRDGNQALVEPMSLDEKLEFFNKLIKVGFKEIEIGFPAASQIEYDFLRQLVERRLIPDDVRVQVLVQCREHLIKRTFEAIQGIKKVVVHIYNSTSTLQRDVVFHKNMEEIKQIAIEGTELVKKYAKDYDGDLMLEYSPESFTGTELEYAMEVCTAVQDTWGEATPEKPIIFNLPSTVEMNTPNVYADQIEWMHKHFKNRESIILSVHPHNDRGCGVSDAEMGILAGADRIEGTLFGNGERTGNVDIITVGMNMYMQGVDPELDFSDMPKLCHAFESFTGMSINPRSPYCGSLVFAAFSGSHQDAIAKGMHWIEEKAPDTWTVPYLPIDPTDIGRNYDADVIRINSQSGKGGVGYILETKYGLNLPAKMREAMSYTAKSVSDHLHKELRPDEIFELFKDTFENVTTPYNINGVHFKQLDEGRIEAQVTSNYEGGEYATVYAEGNGRLNAVSNALKQQYNLQYDLVSYTEHALEQSSSAQAIAYVGIKKPDGILSWGAGVDPDIIRASIDALVTAINNR